MHNVYEVVRDSLSFNKFVLNEIVCIEYTCPLKDEHLGVFSQNDYLIHVLSGKKTWRTLQGQWDAVAGETIYVKKGAATITQHFDDEFCMLGFFLPDDLIQESLQEILTDIPYDPGANLNEFSITSLEYKEYLQGFIQSMLTYFRGDQQPPESLIRLKLKELLISIAYHCDNRLLTTHLRSVAMNNKPSLTQIMENNFCYNLKLEEFAKMTHRSLSKFKRDFFDHYQTTPGKWLMNKRLDHAAKLLLLPDNNISEIAFDCGFENLSHFTRSFKSKFEKTPSDFRD